MTTAVELYPVLHENRETRGIITTDHMDLLCEVPNEYKNFLVIPQNNVSNSGISFQATNTNKFMQSDMRLDLTITLSLEAKTITPFQAAAIAPARGVSYGTPPYLYSQNSCGVESFAINKLISSIGFNLQNKNWQETQRSPTYFDVLGAQYDLNKLKKYGISPFKNQGYLRLGDIYGRGVVSRADLNAMGVNYWEIGCETALNPVENRMNDMQLAARQGYVTVSSVFSSVAAAGGAITVLAQKKVAEYGYADVPLTAGGATYYSNADTLRQDITIVISEYIISPSLSTPYTKHNYSKSYYCGNYPVSLTMNFNQQYLAGMLKNLVWSFNDAGVVNQPTVRVQPQVTSGNLCFYTFDSSKDIVNPYQRTLYYDMNDLTISNKTIKSNDQATVQTSNVVTANLTSLPPYIGGWVEVNMFNNAALVTAAGGQETISTLASYELQHLQNLTISYGSQSDCLLGSKLSWKDICDLTQEVIDNPELHTMILGKSTVDYAASFFSANQASINYSTAVVNRSSFWRKSAINSQGGIFFLIPTSKLNWRPVSQSETVTIPEFNFGSDNYKSLDITMTWNLTNDIGGVAGSTISDVLCQPRIILFTKRVRSLPVDGSSPLFDEKIEFDFINEKSKLMPILNAFYASNNSAVDVNSELQYVGGGFIGDVFNRIKKVLPYAAKAIHMASDGLKMTGHGKRGRPAHKR